MVKNYRQKQFRFLLTIYENESLHVKIVKQ